MVDIDFRKLIRFNFSLGKADYTCFSILDAHTYYRFMSGLSRLYYFLSHGNPVYFNIGNVFSVCFTDVDTLKYCVEIHDITPEQEKVLEELHIFKDSIGNDFVNTVLDYSVGGRL